MTIIELKRYCNYFLSSVLDLGELQATVDRLLLDRFNISKQDTILDQKREIEIDEKYLDSLLRRIVKGEPIQYVVSTENFFNRDFYVDGSVLIPRPETEELVRLIVNENNNLENLEILDIGTGSGAIAITLALSLNNSMITALDISDKALQVAKRNTIYHNASNVRFEKSDILDVDNLGVNYDIIVSNPPYVLDSEKEQMHSNVLDYEPHAALFVSDDNPLVFYEKIAALAAESLNHGGKLYFEINERFSQQVKTLLIDSGFEDVEILIDFRDKPRFIKGCKNGK